jgi:hypothetical protein
MSVVYVYPKCPAGNSEGHWLTGCLHNHSKGATAVTTIKTKNQPLRPALPVLPTYCDCHRAPALWGLHRRLPTGPPTDLLLFAFVHAGCAHVSLASRTSQRLTKAYLTFVHSQSLQPGPPSAEFHSLHDRAMALWRLLYAFHIREGGARSLTRPASDSQGLRWPCCSA